MWSRHLNAAEARAIADELGLDGILLPKQDLFVKATEREVLYSGAFAAGKTRCLCLKAVMRASHPGTREGLCRKHLVSLKATTLKTLLEPDGHLPAVLPKGTYTHHKSDKIIKLHGGGEIVYFGLDEPEKIGSYNLSGCGVDEVVELTEADWTMLLGRIRLDVGIPNQLYAACNPGPPSHWLAERFGLALDYKPHKHCRTIQTQSTDNVFLPPDYIDSLNEFVGVAHKRFVRGLWVGSDRLVYDRWDRDIFVQERTGPWKRCWVGHDAGYTNPTALVLICEDEDGRLHIADEYYETGKTEPEVAEQCVHWYRDYGKKEGYPDIEAFVVDPSAASMIGLMQQNMLPVINAENDVYCGVMTVAARLIVAGDGRPRLTVSPECTNFLHEIESYENRVDRQTGQTLDVPVKRFDHLMDALRYGVVYCDGLFSAPPRLSSASEGDGEPMGPHTQEYELDRMLEDDAVWTTH